MAWIVISFFMRALAKRGLKGFELNAQKASAARPAANI